MLTIDLLDYIYTTWSRFIYLACARRAHNQNSVFTHDDVGGIDSASRFFRIFLQKAESSAAAPRVMSIGVQAQKKRTTVRTLAFNISSYFFIRIKFI